MTHEGLVKEALANDRNCRQSEWAESVAVGSEAFNLGIKERLGVICQNQSLSTDSAEESKKEAGRDQGEVITTGRRKAK